MQKTKTDPSDYIGSLPDDIRQDMFALDKIISKIMNRESRVLWEGVFWGGSQQNIIGYGDYVYERPKGNVEWFKIGLAVQKNYISLYINAVEDKQYVVERYGKAIGKVKVGKSSISFKNISDVDLDKLILLVQKSKDLMS